MKASAQELKRKNLPAVTAVCFAAFMASLDGYIVNISLPAISSYYHVDMNAVSGVVVVFLLFLAGTMLIAGKLADRVGLRNFLFYGYLVFVMGSLGCGLAGSFWMLIVSRAVQGVGAAIMTVAAFSIIAKLLPSTITGWAFGLLSSSGAVGLTIGSPLGGFITDHFSWHWIFFINIPIGIIAAFFTFRVIPGTEPDSGEHQTDHFDIAGSLISFLAIALITLVLSQGHDMGWMSFKTVLMAATVAILLVIFVIVEKRTKSPVFDLSLFSNRVFTLATLSSVFVFLFLSGNFFLLPFYLTAFSGLSIQNSGFVLMIYSVVYMIAGPLAGKASDSVIPENLCMVATVAGGLGCFLFAVFLDSHHGLLPVIVLQVWLGVCMGLFISPNSNLVMNSASKDERGAVSGMFSTLSRLSMMVGVVIFEVVFTAGTNGGKGETMISSMSHQVMADGFETAYFTGGSLLLVGFVCILAVKTKKQHQVPNGAD